MKKFLSILLLMAFIVPMAEAQIVRSTTLGKRESRKTTWYVRAGLSMNNLTGPAMSEAKKEIKEWNEDGEECGFGTRVGYDFEVGFLKYFGKSDLYWGMELGLGTRGGKYNAKDEDSEDKTWVDTYNIKYMPFQIGYMFPVNDKIKIDAHAGVYVLVDFAGKCKEKDKRRDDVREYEYDLNDDYLEATRFDAGLQLGAGVWFDRFNINFTWQRGFAPFLGAFPWGDHWGDKSYQSSNAILSLGVAF